MVKMFARYEPAQELTHREENRVDGKVMNIPVQVWDSNGNQRRMRSISVQDGILCIDIDPTEIIAAP